MLGFKRKNSDLVKNKEKPKDYPVNITFQVNLIEILIFILQKTQKRMINSLMEVSRIGIQSQAIHGQI